MSEVVADAVDAIGDTLDRFGWVQGKGGNSSVGFCLSGATAYTVADHRLRARAIEALAKDLPPVEWTPLKGCDCSTCTDSSGLVCVAWNDTEGRTKQEVLDHVRLTAKRERGL